MTSLDVSGNRLTGKLPTMLLQAADKTDAIFINLSSNQLTATVPGELASFDELTLYLRDNKLEGINPKLCGSSSWNEGEVGKLQCDGPIHIRQPWGGPLRTALVACTAMTRPFSEAPTVVRHQIVRLEADRLVLHF